MVTPDGILVVSGPPCAGKSSVARLLTDPPTVGGVVLIEVDALFSLLLPESDRNREDRMLAYDAAHALARATRRRGRAVVLECTYARLEQRASLVTALDDLTSTPLWVIEVFVTPDGAVERFRGRDQATDLDERLVRERAEAFPYSELAFRVGPSERGPNDVVEQISTWWAGQPSPIDPQAWAEAGIPWGDPAGRPR
jgi:predicted kinase